MFRFFELISHALKRIFVWPILKFSMKKCGKKVILGPKIKFYGIKHLSVGNNVTIGYDCILMCSKANIIIGDDVMFGPRVTVITGSHRIDVLGRTMKSITEKEKLPENDKDIVFEGDNWICSNSIILKGVRIGRGAVVASGAIVTKDVPPYSVVAGVPANVIRMRFGKEEIQKHQSLLNL